MIRFERRKRIYERLNIAPLIDVVLLLLIFFMLSAHFVIQPGLPLTLPASATAQPQEEQDVVVYLSRDGRVALDGQEMTLPRLRAALQARLAKTERKRVVVKPDSDAPVGALVQVMDAAREARADDVVLATRMRQDAEP